MPSVIIDRSTCKYYADRVEHLNKITSKDERTAFIFQTVLAFQKDGWRVALSPSVCRSLESLIDETDMDSLVVLLKCLSKNWDGVITSKFGRHVLHKTWRRCQNEPFCDDSLIKDFCTAFLDHVASRFDHYLEHPHAHHTLRLYVQLLAGVLIDKDPLTNTFSVENATLCTPFDQNYLDTVTNLVQRFLLTKDLHGHARNELISPFTQVLLIIMSLRDQSSFKSNLETIMANAGLFSYSEGQNLPDGFVHSTLVYFTDVVVRLLPGKLFSRFLRNHLFSDANETESVSPVCLMAAHPIASRCLRAVLRRVKKVNDLREILTTLLQGDSTVEPTCTFGLAGALMNGQHAVINQFATLCGESNFLEVQKLFLQALFTAFGFPVRKFKHTDPEDNLIRCVVSMTRLPDLETAENPANETDSADLSHRTGPVSLPGCLLAQTLFQYSEARPKRLVASLCVQSTDRLHAWAQHPMLSRVLEAVFQSPAVSVERKLNLLAVFKPVLVNLACDRHGSRVLDAIWLAADSFPESHVSKEQIAEQLFGAHQRLRSHQYGHFIHYKANLELFASNKPLWRRRMLRSPTATSQKRPVNQLQSTPEPKAKRKSHVQNRSNN